MQFTIAEVRSVNIRHVEMRHHTDRECALHKAAIQYSLCGDYTELFNIALQCGRQATDTVMANWAIATQKLSSMCVDNADRVHDMEYYTVR